MKFYYDLRSQPCRALFLFLKANNISFEPVIVDLATGEHLREDFKKINPYSRVPVIEDDGFILSESIAIVRYLARKYSVPEHWFPTGDIREEARLNEYLHWHHVNVRYVTMMLFRHEYMKTLRGQPVKENEVKQFTAQLSKTLEHLANYFLAGKPFICGSDISVGDIVAVCELTQLLGTGKENLYLSNLKIRKWITRVRERLQPHYDEAFEGIMQMRKLYQDFRGSSKL